MIGEREALQLSEKPKTYRLLGEEVLRYTSTHKGEVLLEIAIPGLPEGEVFAIHILPENARSLGRRLLSLADVAESGQNLN